jgi:hypothetical protein
MSDCHPRESPSMTQFRSEKPRCLKPTCICFQLFFSGSPSYSSELANSWSCFKSDPHGLQTLSIFQHSPKSTISNLSKRFHLSVKWILDICSLDKLLWGEMQGWVESCGSGGYWATGQVKHQTIRQCTITIY